MPPEEDARAILRLALRHEQTLAASLEQAFAQENWSFLAQQDVAVKACYRPEDTRVPVCTASTASCQSARC